MSKAEKIALISGITGQDGSYLTELLLEKGYAVTGSCGARAISSARASSICGAMKRFTSTDCFCITAIYRMEQPCAGFFAMCARRSFIILPDKATWV